MVRCRLGGRLVLRFGPSGDRPVVKPFGPVMGPIGGGLPIQAAGEKTCHG